MSNEGARLKQLHDRILAKLGEVVTVTRPPTTIGGASYVQSLPCDGKPVDPRDYPDLASEATMNVDNAMPHEFQFSGSADVRENDVILYRGWNFVVVNVTAGRVGGVTDCLIVIGQRTLP